MTLVNPDDLRLAAIECEHCEVRIVNPTAEDLDWFKTNHPLHGPHQSERMRRLERLMDRIATIEAALPHDDPRGDELVRRYNMIDVHWVAEWRRVHSQ